MKAIEECLPPEREEDIEKTGWLSNLNTCGRISLCEHTNPSWINEDGVIWPLNRGFPRSRTPSPLSFLSAEKKTEKQKGIFIFETPRRMGMTEFGKNHPFLFQRRRAAHLHYLRWRILTHATSLRSSAIWDPSSIDMNQASPNPFLFCQLILRAFIESLYLIARTRTSGGQSSLRSLTYHRSLVVDRSTSSPIVKDRLF